MMMMIIIIIIIISDNLVIDLFQPLGVPPTVTLIKRNV